MISRHTSCISKDDNFLKLLIWDSRCSQTCCQCSHVHPSAPKVLSYTPMCFQTNHNHSHSTLIQLLRDPSVLKGRPECPPRVSYSPGLDTSKFTLHILADTPGGFQWLKSILLMLPGIILDMHLHGNSIYTVELRRPTALASYMSFVIKFFAILQNIGRV
jgi:hypothetical protein